tara:strand:+ start:2996 stop:3589 length:594 start_codon:yes stop_codon:yes gene_type:complete
MSKFTDLINKTEFWQRAIVLSLIAAVFTLSNHSLMLSNSLRLESMRSDINNEFTNELLWLRLNDFNGQTEELLVGQGRLEGIVEYISGESSDEYDGLWHDGYDRGLAQNDYEFETISNNNYQRGYREAMREAFPNNPEFQAIEVDEFDIINKPTRDVNSAIKTPDFDEKVGETLKDTEELRQELLKSANRIGNKESE